MIFLAPLRCFFYGGNKMKISNVDVEALRSKYQTPLFVYDKANMRNIMNDYVSNFNSNKFETEVIYASKAFSSLKMIDLVKNMNMGLDCVSEGELYCAKRVGFDFSKIYFHGNNKLTHELEYALNNNVGNIVVDNYDELVELEGIAKRLNKKVNVLFRINSGVEAHTHKFIVTSHIDSKFGMLFESDDFKKCLELLEKSNNLLFEGIHSHIGSQIFEMDAFYAAIDKMIEFIKVLGKKLTLDIGGGFGVRYTNEDHPIPFAELSKMLIEYTEKSLEKNNVEIKKLVIEPGRSIVAESGYMLYTIGNIKKTPNKKYYFIDGGMTDNIRPALYQAKYDADVNNDLEKTEVVTVAGKCCESGDLIIEGIKLQPAKKGDLLVVYSVGAYGYSMASNYNKIGLPAVVFVDNGKDELAIRRQTNEDLFKCDVYED